MFEEPSSNSNFLLSNRCSKYEIINENMDISNEGSLKSLHTKDSQDCKNPYPNTLLLSALHLENIISQLFIWKLLLKWEYPSYLLYEAYQWCDIFHLKHGTICTKQWWEIRKDKKWNCCNQNDNFVKNRDHSEDRSYSAQGLYLVCSFLESLH